MDSSRSRRASTEVADGAGGRDITDDGTSSADADVIDDALEPREISWRATVTVCPIVTGAEATDIGETDGREEGEDGIEAWSAEVDTLRRAILSLMVSTGGVT